MQLPMKHDLSPLEKILSIFKNNQEYSNNITHWQIMPARPAKFTDFPDELDHRLLASLTSIGISQLYSHQEQAIRLIQEKKHVVVATGTASGKSLCYQIPILNKILQDANATALMIFPTKALTNDQIDGLHQIIDHVDGKTAIVPAIFDGDTPSTNRGAIREKANIVLSNPDMLNIGILPHHTIWSRFFENLQFVVIDEIHIYRGVFGSHISNLMNRLKRIANFYGSDPVFILTSATIGNPEELASLLIDEDVRLVNQDGSPGGERSLIIYNPPLIEAELGIREGLMVTTEKLLSLLLLQGIQTLVFCRTRKFVEILLKEFRTVLPNLRHKMRGYRSGYLRSERREIEIGLKNGEIILGIATNALELGVDIGGVDAVLLPGYPGSIASLVQRAGRAGRKSNPSLAVFIASMNPLDQYLAKNPTYLIDKNPEKALINPENPLILLTHLQCAAAEVPFSKKDVFGSIPNKDLLTYLDYLVNEGVLFQKNDKYYWISDDYPSQHVSLRSSSSNQVLLVCDTDHERKTIGEIDYISALWMVHPGAVYIHSGISYLVKNLDLEHNVASLMEFNEDYYTEPAINVEIEVMNRIASHALSNGTLNYGELTVHSLVKGYKRYTWTSRQLIDETGLELPETALRTFGYWVVLNEKCINQLREMGNWYSYKNEYGPDWAEIRSSVRKRDEHRCQVCGIPETAGGQHHVHHKIPFKIFSSIEKANELSNLVTLCKNCHSLVESQVKIRSAISGFRYVLENLSPLVVMCDTSDLGSSADPEAKYENHQPSIIFYDAIPAGIGLSEALFKSFDQLLLDAKTLISNCACTDGCPSCVGPTLESSYGGKQDTLALIDVLMSKQ